MTVKYNQRDNIHDNVMYARFLKENLRTYIISYYIRVRYHNKFHKKYEFLSVLPLSFGFSSEQIKIVRLNMGIFI